MNELFAINIADSNGTIITFDEMIDVRYFLIRSNASVEQAAFLRECKYVTVTDGITEGNDDSGRPIKKTDLKNGRFYVDRRIFLSEFASFFDLKRFGKEWKSEGKPTAASFVKQKIQAALLPFKVSQREMTDIYNLLVTQCSRPDILTEPLEIVSADALNTHDFKRPPAIVEGFLYAGLTVFAAPPKTGKSFLSLDLACCVAEGKPFWGFKTASGDALYCDLEGSEWRTKDRLKAIGRGKAPEKLYHAYRVATVDNGFIQQLNQWLNSVESPKLIVIDTLAHIKGRTARGENAYESDTRFLKPLHDLAIEKAVAIIVVTHMRKSNGFISDDPFESIVGSTAQFGCSDGGWIISGKRDADTKTFAAVGRDYEPCSFEIERSRTGQWIFNGTTDERQAVFAESKYQQDKVVSVIRKELVSSGGEWRVTAQQILEAAAKQTGEYLEVDAARMGKHIKEIAPDLLRYDNILVRWPEKGGRGGRLITFEQRGLADGQ